MNETNLSVGDVCYFVRYDRHLDHKGEDFNADNYEVIEGKVIDIKPTVTIVESLRFGRQPLLHKEVFDLPERARLYSYKKTYENLLSWTVKKLQDGDLPRKELLPNFEYSLTCNPLRMTERNLSFGAISPDWGKQPISVSKIILLVTMTVDDLKMLIGILEITAYLNDYAKKLLGKFVVIELQSLYNLLRSLANSDQLKGFHEGFKKDFENFNEQMKQLETKYSFRFIRDKIAAHKDQDLDVLDYLKAWSKINKESITEFLNVMIDFAGSSIAKHYPREATYYFSIGKQSFPDVLGCENSNESYEPFDDFKM